MIRFLEEPPAEFDAETITMRVMLPMMFEAIRCLDEGIVASAAEADVAMIYGTGFPPFRGGLDKIGAEKLLSSISSWAHCMKHQKVCLNAFKVANHFTEQQGGQDEKRSNC